MAGLVYGRAGAGRRWAIPDRPPWGRLTGPVRVRSADAGRRQVLETGWRSGSLLLAVDRTGPARRLITELSPGGAVHYQACTGPGEAVRAASGRLFVATEMSAAAVGAYLIVC